MSVDNLRDTITPKSDQLNADDLLGRTITLEVTAVKRGNSAEQPVFIEYVDGNGKPYKPCKSMRRVLIHAWGDDGHKWVGKKMMLYCDPEVKFGGIKVGGIRISHVSHIDRDLVMTLTASKGNRTPYDVKVLLESYPEEDFLKNKDAWIELIVSGKKTTDQIFASIAKKAPLTVAQKEIIISAGTQAIREEQAVTGE